MERVFNAPFKELPANLPTHPPTHANSLHTATAVPHIPRQSKPAQAGLSPTHYPSRRSLGRDLLAHLAAAWRFAQARLLRTSVGGSSAVAEARFGVETAGTSTWCGAGLGLGFGLGIGYGVWLGGWVASVDG